MRIARLILVTAACGFAPTPVLAQRVPFFAGAATGFDPEISVVNSGVIQDAQAVVSHDRKYVTLNMRAQNSQLLALRSFSFAGGGSGVPLGLVGGARRDNGDRDRRGGQQNVLDRPGTTLVARLED